MWDMAKALFSPLINFFTDLEFPFLGGVTFFDLFIGLTLIDVIISVVYIILGVSTGSGDVVSSLTYDYLDNKYYLSDSDVFIQKSRIRKPNYENLRTQYRIDKSKFKMRAQGKMR